MTISKKPVRKQAVKKASVCAALGCMVMSVSTMHPDAAQTDAEKALVGQRAFAQCEEYINIRKEASRDSEVVAKIYQNGMATILDAENGWYRIRSGNAEGYVSGEYFATGEEADRIAKEAAYNVAKIHPESLNIRKEPDENSGVLGAAHQNEELEVVAYDGDWMKVALGQDSFGYVNAYYVDYLTYYPQAETLEEEQARLEAEQGQPGAGKPSENNTPENSEPDYTESETPEYTEPETPDYSEPESSEPDYSEPDYSEPETPDYSEPDYTEPETPDYSEPDYTEPETPDYSEPDYSEPDYSAPDYTESETSDYSEPESSAPDYSEPESSAPDYSEPDYSEPESSAPDYTEPEAPAEDTASSSGVGQQIVDYAVQFVGNPYVWGGTSLTNGADCSGFTQSVFANFGIGLSRTAASQSGGGSAVSLSDIQAGDLLFYSDGSGISHVAIYMGGGQIVHAANASTGIAISDAYYSTPVSASRYW